LQNSVEIPGYFRYVAFGIALICVAGSAFLMIIYGIRFDTGRDGLVEHSKWLPGEVGQQFVNGQTLRESLDDLPTCQLSCLQLYACSGVVIRNSDKHCFEQSGIPNNGTNPNFILYQFVDQRTRVTNQWLYSLTIGVAFQMVLDGLKVILAVSLIFWCFGRAHRQAIAHNKSVAKMSTEMQPTLSATIDTHSTDTGVHLDTTKSKNLDLAKKMLKDLREEYDNKQITEIVWKERQRKILDVLQEDEMQIVNNTEDNNIEMSPIKIASSQPTSQNVTPTPSALPTPKGAWNGPPGLERGPPGLEDEEDAFVF